MTQASVESWCVQIQTKLMATIDAIWASIEDSDDPAAIRKARDRAKTCGELAANARKIATMIPPRRPAPRPSDAALDAVIKRLDEMASPPEPPRGIDRLKGGGRSRL